jgi:cyclopropane-fatty-acyl-phospholipid synthase
MSIVSRIIGIFLPAGVMPSHHLIRQYSDLFEVEKQWRWSGAHYQRTALDWLRNFDTHRDGIERVLRPVYGNGRGKRCRPRT